MNNPFDFFDAIFCINLNTREDRWIKCVKQFKDLGIEQKVQRFSACKIENRGNDSQKFLGKCGCSLSHFEICKIAQEKKYKNYLVLEDDFEFILNKDTTFDLLTKLITEIPDNWDMCYLGANFTDIYGVFPIENFSDNLFKLKACHTTHAIAFNEKFYNLFLENAPDINSIYNWTNNYEIIDVFLNRYIFNNINCFINKILITTQYCDFSDIEQTVCNYVEHIEHNFNYFKSLIAK
jgi:GR25 family glycosyltransferase involved in LPS biosynthesis